MLGKLFGLGITSLSASRSDDQARRGDSIADGAIRHKRKKRRSAGRRSSVCLRAEQLEQRDLLTAFTFQAEQLPLTPNAGDWAGNAVAVDGDYMAVGARLDDGAGEIDAGAVFMYVRDDNGTPADPSDDSWAGLATLTAATPEKEADFGFSVAMDDGTLVVGSPSSGGSGSAYVFTLNNGNWTQQQQLFVSGVSGASLVGTSVDIDGDRIVVGVPQHSVSGAPLNGAAAVFERQSTTFTQSTVLVPVDSSSNKNFGNAVAIDGNRIVVGANQDTNGLSTGFLRGSAYVFRATAGVWNQQQKIVPADGQDFSAFGTSVDVSGSTIVVGANQDRMTANFGGSAYVYRESAGQWGLKQKLEQSDATGNDYFGYDVAIVQDRLAVGAPMHNIGDNEDDGAVYVYVRSGDTFSLDEKILATTMDTDTDNDRFGAAVDMDATLLGVGATHDSAGATSSGSAYAFGAPEQLPPASVVAQHIAYNDSAYDNDNVAANSDDDNAIATNKQPLLPGQNAAFANYTNFHHGINMIMVDIANRQTANNITAADFQLAIGNVNNTNTWAPAPAPAEVTVRAGAGVDGSDRVTLRWNNGSMVKTWLQVRVLATVNTGLDNESLFYFGNAPAETGDSGSNAFVTAMDFAAARDGMVSMMDTVPVDSLADFDRDAEINAVDMMIARDNATNLTNSLELITPPFAPSPLLSRLAASQEASGLISAGDGLVAPTASLATDNAAMLETAEVAEPESLGTDRIASPSNDTSSNSGPIDELDDILSDLLS